MKNKWKYAVRLENHIIKVRLALSTQEMDAFCKEIVNKLIEYDLFNDYNISYLNNLRRTTKDIYHSTTFENTITMFERLISDLFEYSRSRDILIF